MKIIVLGSLLLLSGCMGASGQNVKDGTFIIELCNDVKLEGNKFVGVDCDIKHVNIYDGDLDEKD